MDTDDDHNEVGQRISMGLNVGTISCRSNIPCANPYPKHHIAMARSLSLRITHKRRTESPAAPHNHTPRIGTHSDRDGVLTAAGSVERSRSAGWLLKRTSREQRRLICRHFIYTLELGAAAERRCTLLN
ncbi:hypothetical protein MTO96_028424 [Rhipicephalus appendiculatus]